MFRRLSAAALLLVPAASFATTTLADGSFEMQAATSTGSFCYFIGTAGDGPCTNTPWTGAGAGLQIETNTAWPGAPTPDGAYYAFVQGTGILSQIFTATSATYTLNWLDAGRPSGVAGGAQTYDVLLRNLTTSSSSTLGSFATTTNQAFTAQTIGGISLLAGQSYVLDFQGTNAMGGDNTAFIDAVSFVESSVPEPATWAMLVGGFGMIGGAMRARRRTARLA